MNTHAQLITLRHALKAIAAAAFGLSFAYAADPSELEHLIRERAEAHLSSAGVRANAGALDEFRPLVRTATWTEQWPDAEGRPQPREVTGEVWTEAIQAALDKHGSVFLPARREPYYLDAPIVLRSGQSLRAERDAEIRLKPGSNICMVRNEHIVGFADKPVQEGLEPDTDITIEGGIWTTLATGGQEVNGNLRGNSSKLKPVPGTHGVILLHNVRRVTVRNITVRQSKPFAVHLGNVHEFTVDGVTLDQHKRDGVHVNGPASHGVIRHVRGDSGDDTVALNAWEWKNYTPPRLEFEAGAPGVAHYRAR